MSRKTINILGVTGSIGRSAVDVICSAPEKFDVQAVSAQSSVSELAEIAVRVRAKTAIIGNEDYYAMLKEKLSGTGIKAEAGREALLNNAGAKVDLSLVAIVGMAGLRPVVAAIRNSKAVAIANKEPLAAAGPLVMREVKKSGAILLPVDSEHNAVFQVFDFKRRDGIKKIILTASGGPFRTWKREAMARATKEQALAHPNWVMGPKITVDSATMMNKALEIIEAHYLFDMPADKIEVMVHPQSIIHSMVEYRDGSVLAQMAASDMRTPIAHALAWPERIDTPGRTLDWTQTKELTFEQPDMERFPALRLAYEALEQGPYSCLALNAANEIAVEYFLNKKTGFLDTINIVEGVLSQISSQKLENIEDFENSDQAVRQLATIYIDKQDYKKASGKS
ncbi:MAG: 1-deoxy-D-xylulose-5-phosphate reductoisomerase [Alphaproteobacteria bacterium PRO2]|nr:1-deoxy-D-xylulose-5-phosphate reductoisomerase [Alphaproteobacteria bacterium PRO2]